MIPRFVRLDETVSTNDVALEMARQGEPEGIVVTACSQTRGKGRLGRTWWDRPGESAILSILLRPPTQSVEHGHLAFVSGMAVARCMEDESCSGIALKWPNDVLVGDRKIAGILVEMENGAAVVGIGVNVNQSDFPPDIAQSATSILIQTGQQRDVISLSERIADHVLANYETYLALGFEEILAGWRKYMWGLGKRVVVHTGGQAFAGEITGVHSSGALMLSGQDGAEHTIHAADSIRLV